MSVPGKLGHGGDSSPTLHSSNMDDTQHEQVFEAIVRIAKRLFDVPMVAVTVTDSTRQWYTASSGLEPDELLQRPAISGQALVEDDSDAIVISDTLDDARHASNPMVASEPFARFYGGCPIKAPDGHHIGTVCLIDQNPRHFDQADIEALEDLALIAAREIASSQYSDTDPLTEIQNQRGFSLLAEYKLSLCQRENLPVSLVYFDLESFEPIAEQLGREEGNRVLMLFAEELSGLFRQSDVAARLSGNKFVLLLINCTKRSAEACVARMSDAIRQYNEQSTLGFDLSFSSGVAEYEPSRHSAIGELIAEADVARTNASGPQD